MEVLQWIAKYWVEWACVIISGGVVFFAKHYVKMHKQIAEDKWQEKEKNMCGKIIDTIETKISKVENESREEDIQIHAELDDIHDDVDSLKVAIDINKSGVLSMQGKQFRDYCNYLLDDGHIISVDEYEQFEADYEVYKGLGGNHKGDALHDRVIDKVKVQMQAINKNLEPKDD